MSFMSFVPKWLQVTLVISIVAATVTDVDDECQASECSLELLHLRAKKISQAAEDVATATKSHEVENELETQENGGVCLKYVNCRNGFFNGIRCNGGRYCTKWGGGGRVCRKYVNCKRGFFNGINCHGSRYCVSWGLLQEGEEESAEGAETETEDAQGPENPDTDADAGNVNLNQEAENDLQDEENKGHCVTWATCRNGFFNGKRCSGGRYCTRWGGGGGVVGGRRRWRGGGRVCRKYVNCKRGFFNGINCHGSRYCVSWGLLQEGEEESAEGDGQ